MYFSNANYREFLTDLSKIQNEYNYHTNGHGSIDITDISEDNKRIAAVNWSASGAQSPKYAKQFSEALIKAIEACEKFNATHDIDAI